VTLPSASVVKDSEFSLVSSGTSLFQMTPGRCLVFVLLFGLLLYFEIVPLATLRECLST